MSQNINHPEDALLVSYAAGSLPLSQALCVSAHLEHCHSCTQNLKQLNRVGGELMQQLKPSPVGETVKEELLSRLDSLPLEASCSSPQQESDAPKCLHQFIQGNLSDVAWQRVAADIHSVELCRDINGAKVELLKIKAGGSASTHTHLGDEYTVILEGSFSDEDGVYRQGDFLVRNSQEQHTPMATLDQECICLAVTEGPVQFTGWFARILNPLIRRSYA